MKDYWKEPEGKKANKKKIMFIIIAVIIIIAIIAFFAVYTQDKNFREWVDTNILQKEVNQDKLATINIVEGENPKVYAFNQYRNFK